jgi:hypothetical protein
VSLDTLELINMEAKSICSKYGIPAVLVAESRIPAEHPYRVRQRKFID